MSTYNNVLGDFISPADDLSDLDDYDDSASEPEPEMASRSMSTQSVVLDERTQMVETLLSKSNKCTYIRRKIHNQGFSVNNSPESQYELSNHIF